jgi:mono/diheme cytochrome c family protein/peroxiredoxin
MGCAAVSVLALAAAGVASIGGVAGAGASPAAEPLRAADFLLADQGYQAWQLSRLSDDKAVVIMSYAAGDAEVKKDAPALMALKTAYADKGVDVLALDSRLGEKRDRVIPDIKANGLELPVLFDYEQLVGEQLGVTRAAETLVIDPKGWTVVYRGPVGDGAQAAVDALVNGKPVTAAYHPAKGSLIAFPERARSAEFAKISYAETIAPIVQDKCATCHQPGGIGPMPLNSYEQIKAFAPMIREVIRTHRMPPYLADETVGAFKDDDRLSSGQIKTLVHWVEAGAPRGDGADPLAKIKFQAPDWPLGKPDVILNVPPVKIAASGVMDYQHPVVPNTMSEGRWMKATTFRVSDRQVVHHILTGVVQGDYNVNSEASEAQWGASLGGYGPGRGSNIEPEGTGVWVPPSGGVAFQNHYTPYGKETTETTQMGLYWYKKGEEPKYVLRTFLIPDFSIEIPANTERHHEIAYIEFPKDAILYGLTPHAHHRGAATSVAIRYPNGKEVMLLALPRYDFNWQYEYFLKEPLKVPAGAKIIARWTYDNSKRNPANPDPNKVVHWGEQSSEEMLATYLHYRWVDETVKDQKPEYEKALQANLLFGVLDDNIDGKLEKSELRGKAGEMLLKYFDIIDKNHDGFITPDELAAAQALLPKGRRGGGAAPAATPVAAPAKATPTSGPAPAPAIAKPGTR